MGRKPVKKSEKKVSVGLRLDPVVNDYLNHCKVEGRKKVDVVEIAVVNSPGFKKWFRNS